MRKCCVHVKRSTLWRLLMSVEPIDFPMETNHKLGLSNGKFLSDPMQYQRIVGQLIYLTLICPS